MVYKIKSLFPWIYDMMKDVTKHDGNKLYEIIEKNYNVQQIYF